MSPKSIGTYRVTVSYFFLLSVLAGVPPVYYYGVEGEFSCMIMGILGPNLIQLFDFCDCKFSIATTCNIWAQILSRLEVLHSHQFVHRDMKPENICIGQGKK